jgi:hypothetical protein
MLLLGGVDSYVEEFFPIMQAMASAGYQVIGFEAPAGLASAFNNVFLPRRDLRTRGRRLRVGRDHHPVPPIVVPGLRDALDVRRGRVDPVSRPERTDVDVVLVVHRDRLAAGSLILIAGQLASSPIGSSSRGRDPLRPRRRDPPYISVACDLTSHDLGPEGLNSLEQSNGRNLLRGMSGGAVAD